MKIVAARIYSALVVLSLLGLLAWGVVDWNQKEEAALDSNYKLLRAVAGQLTDLSLNFPSLPPKTLSVMFRNEVLSDPRWKMLLLSSQGHGPEYYWGPQPATTLPTGASGSLLVDLPQWKPQFPSEHLLQIKVYTPWSDSYVLQGIYSFYGRSETFEFLKVCGFFLLGLLLATCLFVLVLSLQEDEPAPEPVRRPQPSPVYPQPLRVKTEALDDLPSLAFDGEPNREKDEYWFDEDLEEAPEVSEEPAREEPVRTASAKVSAQDSPQLFSPATGLSWESFMLNRLESELDRCASQNQDLCLLFFSGTGLQDASKYQRLGREIGSFFPYKDLSFEYSDHRFAVVLANQSLEKTLKEVQNFLRKTDSVLPGVNLRAGVASRSGRLLSSANLIKEAESALRRAVSGQERVVGLKSDPDKYREHLLAEAARLSH